MACSAILGSMLRATRPAAVACVLSGALLIQPVTAQASTSPPSGLPYKGLLQLKGGNATQVTYDPTGVLDAPALPAQSLNTIRRNDCRLDQPQASQLLGFSATAGGSAVPVGLVTGSLGAYNGSQGTPCSRLAAGFDQELTVDLGRQLESAIPDVAFYRLDLDIEAKSNLVLELQILRDGVVTDRYYLRTGSGIVAGEGSTLPGSRIFNCTAQSDSGPDSGSRDNCRWQINELGHGFRLKPLAGEGSLEGGGDPGVAAFTSVYLTEADIGALGCGIRQDSGVPIDENTNTIGDGFNDAQCAVSRIDPTGIGGTCTEAVGYVFRTLGGVSAEGCELLKSPSEQLAASIDILFPPEPSTLLGLELKTEIEFTGPDGLVPFTPERCVGTVVLDPNGKRTIKEVLLGTLDLDPGAGVTYLSDANDAVPGNGFIDWACVLDNEQEYLGPAAGPNMQVFQTILFWGDIRFSRQ